MELYKETETSDTVTLNIDPDDGLLISEGIPKGDLSEKEIEALLIRKDSDVLDKPKSHSSTIKSKTFKEIHDHPSESSIDEIIYEDLENSVKISPDVADILTEELGDTIISIDEFITFLDTTEKEIDV